MGFALEDKRVLITGATGGIGREIVLQFARAGARIIAVGRSPEKLEQLKASTASLGAEPRCLNADLNNLSEVTRVIEITQKDYGGIDVLVNSAGIYQIAPIESASLEHYEHCFNVNVRAPWLLARAFIKGMVEAGGGRIVSIGSSSSYAGYAETAIYCA